MAIKEVLMASLGLRDMVGLDRRREREPKVVADKPHNIDHISGYLTEVYRSPVLHSLLVLNKGRDMLDTAGASELLQEVAGVLRLYFKDVEVSERQLIESGGVAHTVVWDRKWHLVWNRRVVYTCKLLGVIALPPTDQLIVLGKKEEVLSKDKWTDHKFLEHTIASAFKKPLIVEGYP